MTFFTNEEPRILLSYKVPFFYYGIKDSDLLRLVGKHKNYQSRPELVFDFIIWLIAQFKFFFKVRFGFLLCRHNFIQKSVGVQFLHWMSCPYLHWLLNWLHLFPLSPELFTIWKFAINKLRTKLGCVSSSSFHVSYPILYRFQSSHISIQIFSVYTF